MLTVVILPDFAMRIDRSPRGRYPGRPRRDMGRASLAALNAAEACVLERTLCGMTGR